MDKAADAEKEYEQDAIQHYLIDTTMPIIVRDSDRFFIGGTGTLFKIAERRFLITAAMPRSIRRRSGIFQLRTKPVSFTLSVQENWLHTQKRTWTFASTS